MARDERLPYEVPIESPELALVDPDLRALVLRATQAAPRPEQEPEPVAAETCFVDETAREALRRLTELAGLEPAARPRRSPTLASLAFALVAWGTLALVLVSQPWGV